ncbi:hypothetical protein [Wolbachia endosymbiont of Brugia pahangi]|uniref:hypothetical protein n=1 Tax=Wolbachia endosymbiont of Brugia pahangi TaxID=96495 RepID=UPI0014359D9B|nr:hypothetical protein [Wolbachia endosymbiont of Brugia pahangi]QIT36558.1 putative protein WF-4 [Wolbachia endosymbiont of Brugia pahangi]
MSITCHTFQKWIAIFIIVGQIIDIICLENSALLELVEEERIKPRHLGNYKIEKHKQSTGDWLINNPSNPTVWNKFSKFENYA